MFALYVLRCGSIQILQAKNGLLSVVNGVDMNEALLTQKSQLCFINRYTIDNRLDLYIH